MAKLLRYEALCKPNIAPEQPDAVRVLSALFGFGAEQISKWILEVGVRGAFDGAWKYTDRSILGCWEAWELCYSRELLPASALENEARVFRVSFKELLPSAGGVWGYAQTERGALRVPMEKVHRNHEGQYAELSHPAYLADVVAFASAWPAVLQAEALAREAVERLARWEREVSVQRVEWVASKTAAFLEDTMLQQTLLSLMRDRQAKTLVQTLRNSVDRCFEPSTVRIFEGHLRWTLACERSLSVPGMAPFAEQSFASLSNPYEPLLELMELGFLCEGMVGSALRLRVPSLGTQRS